jgi:hypothetical protein
VTRSVEKGGCAMIFLKCGSYSTMYYEIFYDFSAVLERFWSNIGGYWALFEARSWGEVGSLLPTSSL